MKKLVASYSWPVRDRSVNRYSTFPFVNEDKVWEDFNEFLAGTAKYFSIPGFTMNVKVVDE